MWIKELFIFIVFLTINSVAHQLHKTNAKFYFL